MTTSSEIANRIKSRRMQLRLRQQELAEKVGVSLVTITRWENPESGRTPNSSLIPKLAEALNTTVNYLMGLEDMPDSSSGDTPADDGASVDTGRDIAIDNKVGHLVFRDGERVVDLPDTPDNKNLYWRIVEKMLAVPVGA